MKDDHISIEFAGEDMGEILNKVINFLNMFKGINLGESEGRHEHRGKDFLAEKPSK